MVLIAARTLIVGDGTLVVLREIDTYLEQRKSNAWLLTLTVEEIHVLAIGLATYVSSNSTTTGVTY
jgi:hypothetical protein